MEKIQIGQQRSPTALEEGLHHRFNDLDSHTSSLKNVTLTNKYERNQNKSGNSSRQYSIVQSEVQEKQLAADSRESSNIKEISTLHVSKDGDSWKHCLVNRSIGFSGMRQNIKISALQSMDDAIPSLLEEPSSTSDIVELQTSQETTVNDMHNFAKHSNASLVYHSSHMDQNVLPWEKRQQQPVNFKRQLFGVDASVASARRLWEYNIGDGMVPDKAKKKNRKVQKRKPIDAPLLGANLAYSVHQFKNQQRNSWDMQAFMTARDSCATSNNQNNERSSSVLQQPEIGMVKFQDRWSKKKNMRQQRKEFGLSQNVEKKQIVSKTQQQMQYELKEERLDMPNDTKRQVFGNSEQSFTAVETNRVFSNTQLNSGSIQLLQSERPSMSQLSVSRAYKMRSGSNMSIQAQMMKSGGQSTERLIAPRKSLKSFQQYLKPKVLNTHRKNAQSSHHRTADNRSDFVNFYDDLNSCNDFAGDRSVQIVKKLPEIPCSSMDGLPYPIVSDKKNELTLNQKIKQRMLPQQNKMARIAKSNDFLSRRQAREAKEQVEALNDAHHLYYSKQRPLGKSDIFKDGKDCRTEVKDIELKPFVIKALREVNSMYRKQDEEKISNKLSTSLDLVLNESLRKLDLLHNQDLLELHSDSDASQYECDAREIEMENIIIGRLEDESNTKGENRQKFGIHDGRNQQSRYRSIAKKIIQVDAKKSQMKIVVDKAKHSRLERSLTASYHRIRQLKKAASLANEKELEVEEEKEIKKTFGGPSEFLLEKMSHVVEMLEFIEIGRRMQGQVFQQIMSKRPMLVYLKQIEQAREIALPLVNKVVNGKLVLTGYTLDSGHFSSLASSISESRQQNIDSVYLDNCGVDDHELALLLTGLSNQQGASGHGFQRFVYKNNVFLDESLEAIKPIFQHKHPNNLRELRLVNLQNIKPQVFEELLEHLIEVKPQLLTLGLVQLHLGQVAIEIVTRFVKMSDFLEDLDLSWNDLIPIHFPPLLDVISKNRRLKSLNLSWNTMIDKADQNNSFSFQVRNAMEQLIEERKLALELGQIGETAIVQHPEYVIRCLNEFIRYNRNLQSLNLSNNGLNSQVLVGITQSLRHAKGLLCLHLTANPGLNDKVESFYRERLSVVQHEEKVSIDIKVEDLQSVTEAEYLYMSDEARYLSEKKLANQTSWKLEEVYHYLNNKRLKPLFNRQDVEQKSEGRDLQLTRILGQSKEIQGSGQWRMQVQKDANSCWHCDNWMYTLVFWHPDIGIHNQNNSMDCSKATKSKVEQTIRNICGDKISENDSPILYSQDTNWRPRPFMNIFDYLNLFEPDEPIEPDFKTPMIELAKKVHVFSDFNKINQSKLDRVNKFIEDQIAQARDNFHRRYRCRRILQTQALLEKHLKYKNPMLINYDQVEKNNQFDRMFVLPIFLPPGKVDFFIRSNVVSQNRKSFDRCADDKFEFFYSRHIIGVRQERTPFFAKQLKTNEKTMNFVKEGSVFEDWREETPKLEQIALRHDFQLMKLSKILRSYDEQDQVKDIILQYYRRIRCIFIAACVNGGSPPDYGIREFSRFCDDAQIRDSQLNTGIINTLFKAANFEEVEQEGNADNALNRFEFIEILVRLAREKFIVFGNMHSVAAATKRLIQTYILPMEAKLIPYEQWRYNELYTNEINDLLMANIFALRKLYYKVASIKDFPKKKNLMEIYNGQLPTIDQFLFVFQQTMDNVDDQRIIQAFYASKMFVQQESEMVGLIEYSTLQWGEYMEFIGRLAQFKYHGYAGEHSLPLIQKVSNVLDELVPLMGATRIDPPDITQALVISDSDDDY